MKPFLLPIGIVYALFLTVMVKAPAIGQEPFGGLPQDTYEQALGETTKEIFIRRAADPRFAAIGPGMSKEQRFRHYRLLADDAKLAAQAFLYQYRLTINNPPFEPEKP